MRSVINGFLVAAVVAAATALAVFEVRAGPVKAIEPSCAEPKAPSTLVSDLYLPADKPGGVTVVNIRAADVYMVIADGTFTYNREGGTMGPSALRVNGTPVLGTNVESRGCFTFTSDGEPLQFTIQDSYTRDNSGSIHLSIYHLAASQ